MTVQARLQKVTSALVDAARRPEAALLLPVLPALGYWLWGEVALFAAAFALPGVLAVVLVLTPSFRRKANRDPLTGLVQRGEILHQLDLAMKRRDQTQLSPACIVLSVDEADAIARRHGHSAYADMLREIATRLGGALRQSDTVARLDGACFAIALSPVMRADLEAVLQIASRIQSVVEDQVILPETEMQISVSVGFSTPDRTAGPEADGAGLLAAAEAAMEDAMANGPGAIRAYTCELAARRADVSALRADLAAALNGGEMLPYFQPQISTDTGEISGFEVLVRWQHPTRGLLTPDTFLPVLHAAGLTERLGERMLYHALGALRAWDDAGHRIASVGVNFSADELRNPRLPDRIAWELDRFNLSADRLGIEILESIAAGGGDDVVVQNVARLAAMGCRIDLDDFGTGHASIANIRRFAVSRIKIDRSFVSGMSDDRERQSIVAAILSMAEQLGLDTIAEGVETGAEHALLSQLGCAHVQGFGIARPMPESETLAWIERHKAQTAEPLRLQQGGT